VQYVQLKEISFSVFFGSLSIFSFGAIPRSRADKEGSDSVRTNLGFDPSLKFSGGTLASPISGMLLLILEIVLPPSFGEIFNFWSDENVAEVIVVFASNVDNFVIFGHLLKGGVCPLFPIVGYPLPLSSSCSDSTCACTLPTFPLLEVDPTELECFFLYLENVGDVLLTSVPAVVPVVVLVIVLLSF